ncbi:MAG: hypothetical protein QM692_12540 [Thermomicrobiales bacterium]
MSASTHSPWRADNTATLEVHAHDRQQALQALLDAAVAMMFGADAVAVDAAGPQAPVRGEGADLGAAAADLLDDLCVQVELHGLPQAAMLDGVLRRDRGGWVAWGYFTPQGGTPRAVTFERAGEIAVLAETHDAIGLRAALRRLG